MSRQFFKIGALALLAVLIVWGTMAAQKTVVAAGSGGGQDIPLKATFSAGSFGPYGPFGYLDSKISNDLNSPYVHQGTKTGQNQILIVQPSVRGNLMMVVYRSAPGNRYMNLYFDKMLFSPVPIGTLPTDWQECLEPYFIYPTIQYPIQTTYFRIYTGMECRRFDYVDENGNPYADLVPTTKYLNFTKMLPGETKYVTSAANCIQFRTTNNPGTPNYDESYDSYGLFHEPYYFVVQAGNQNGIAYWTIKPFAERFKAVDKEDGLLKDHDYGCVPRRVVSGISRDCDHGTYMMPFELKIERLK